MHIWCLTEILCVVLQQGEQFIEHHIAICDTKSVMCDHSFTKGNMFFEVVDTGHHGRQPCGYMQYRESEENLRENLELLSQHPLYFCWSSKRLHTTEYNAEQYEV